MKNVILQRMILPKIASNVSYSFIEMHMWIEKIWGDVHQCMYKTKICDIDDLQKCLMQSLQTWFNFEQNVIEAAIDHAVARPSEIICACWWRRL